MAAQMLPISAADGEVIPPAGQATTLVKLRQTMNPARRRRDTMQDGGKLPSSGAGHDGQGAGR